jgi:hypothetical protein
VLSTNENPQVSPQTTRVALRYGLLSSIRREHIAKRIGKINEPDAAWVDRALAIWLDFLRQDK